MIKDLNNFGPLPPIYFKFNPPIGKEPDKYQDYLKVNIETRRGEANRKMVLIYVPIFNTGLENALLKLLFLLSKILKGKNLPRPLNAMQ